MGKPSEQKVYEFEEFRLDAAHLMLYRKNEEIPLAPKAVETLIALVEKRGEILSKEELMNAIWPDSIVEEANLSQYLYILRKTLGKKSGGQHLIETLRRRGYRFTGDVSVKEGAAVNSNGRPGSPEAIANTFAGEVSETKSRNQRAHRVERQGNVLAVADWRESESAMPEEKAALPLKKRPGPTIFPMAALALAAILLAAAAFAWYRYGAAPGASDASNSKGDLTFLSLTNGEDVNAATISPDGKYFVYSSRDGENSHLWLQQAGQASRVEIVAPFPGTVTATIFTPDSQFIYFVAANRSNSFYELYRVATLGGIKTKILEGHLYLVSFSPGGDEMAFVRFYAEAGKSSLVVASSDGKRERILLARTPGDKEMVAGIAWSPDGKLIAYSTINMQNLGYGPCTISGIDPQSGEIKALSPEKWDNCYRMEWTRDGQGLVFVGTKYQESYSTRRDQVYYLSIATGESRRLTTDGNRHQGGSLGLTEKDEILAVPFSRSSQIWAMDAGGDSRSALQITDGQADGRGGIAPLADRRIAYLTRQGDGFSIWLMGADGSGRKQVTYDPPAIEELRAPPDGRFFVFAAKSDRFVHLYRVDSDGANLRQLTFGESSEVDSSVSPDGNWIVYDSESFDGGRKKAVVKKVSSDGGEPILLTEDDCRTPHFSPDGKFVSCVSESWKKLSVISVETGETVKTFDTLEAPVLNCGSRWTPDGKALAYINYDKKTANLWLQPINGDPPRRLTDFTNGDIYNFAFSADGSRLYLARGNSVRNAVLISNFR